METIVVYAIIVAAGLWILVSTFGRRKSSACSSGCAGCSASDAASDRSPRQPALVSLRLPKRNGAAAK